MTHNGTLIVAADERAYPELTGRLTKGFLGLQNHSEEVWFRNIRIGPALDLGDVRGQEPAKRALTISAAGAHSLLMMGPPGTGKSMLAQRLPGLLPSLSDRP